MSHEFDAWSQEWRTAGTVPPDLLARVRRERRDARLGLAGGWLATLVLTGGSGWLLSVEAQPANRAALAFAALVPPLLMFLHTRRESALRGPEGEAATRCVAEWQRRLRAEIALGRTWWPLALVIGFVAAWTPWKLVEGRELYAERPALAVAAVAGLVLLIAGTAAAQVLQRRANERKADALERLAREIADE